MVSQVGTLTKGGSASTGSASVPVTRDAGTLTGDLVLVILSTKVGYNAAPSLSVSTPPDGTWTRNGYGAYGTTVANGHWEAWSKVATTDGAQSYTFTMFSANAYDWFCVVLRGDDAANLAVLGSTSQQAPGTSVSTAAATTTESAEFLVRFIGGGVASGSTAMTGSGLVWGSPASKLGDQQGSSGTGVVWGSVALETGPTPAATIAARSITLPNSPNGIGTVTLGIPATAAPTSPPANTVAPAITTDGTPVTGEIVTGDIGTWTNSPTSYSPQWKRNGSNISGATASAYTLSGLDEGQSVTYAVTATNGIGSTTATSAAITPGPYVPPDPPVNSVAPAITGTPAVGQVLTCGAGTWNPAGDTYTYQWRRNGSTISGATASTYTVVSADVGTNTLSCSVTGTNAGGSATATSATVSPYTAAGNYAVIRYRLT